MEGLEWCSLIHARGLLWGAGLADIEEVRRVASELFKFSAKPEGFPQIPIEPLPGVTSLTSSQELAHRSAAILSPSTLRPLASAQPHTDHNPRRVF